MLKSDLPQQELSLDRLKHEALSITGGGVGKISRLFLYFLFAILISGLEPAHSLENVMLISNLRRHHQECFSHRNLWYH